MALVHSGVRCNGLRSPFSISSTRTGSGTVSSAAACRNAGLDARNVQFGKRIVEGARHLAPALGDRMMAARLLGKSVFICELLPQDIKLEIDQISHEEAVGAASFLAAVLGRAHGRQMDL
jgi:uncharacterized protein (DUF2252 family)